MPRGFGEGGYCPPGMPGYADGGYVGFGRVNISDLKNARGQIGNQGFTAEGVVRIINEATGSHYSDTGSLKAVLDDLKSKPSLVQQVTEFIERNPVDARMLPDGSVSLKDGHHRAFLADQLGMKSIRTVQPVPPVTASPIEQVFMDMASGFKESARKKIEADLAAGKPVVFTKPEAVKLVEADPRFEFVRNPDGSVRVTGLKTTPVGAAVSPRIAPATFGGIQEGFGTIPSQELWHLTEDIQGHPKGSTLTRTTLEKEGYIVPGAKNPSSAIRSASTTQHASAAVSTASEFNLPGARLSIRQQQIARNAPRRTSLFPGGVSYNALAESALPEVERSLPPGFRLPSSLLDDAEILRRLEDAYLMAMSGGSEAEKISAHAKIIEFMRRTSPGTGLLNRGGLGTAGAAALPRSVSKIGRLGKLGSVPFLADLVDVGSIGAGAIAGGGQTAVAGLTDALINDATERLSVPSSEFRVPSFQPGAELLPQILLGPIGSRLINFLAGDPKASGDLLASLSARGFIGSLLANEIAQNQIGASAVQELTTRLALRKRQRAFRRADIPVRSNAVNEVSDDQENIPADGSERGIYSAGASPTMGASLRNKFRAPDVAADRNVRAPVAIDQESIPWPWEEEHASEREAYDAGQPDELERIRAKIEAYKAGEFKLPPQFQPRRPATKLQPATLRALQLPEVREYYQTAASYRAAVDESRQTHDTAPVAVAYSAVKASYTVMKRKLEEQGLLNRDGFVSDRDGRATLRATPLTRGFAVGGGTGSGRLDEIAGVVHKEEYVLPAAGLRELQRMTSEVSIKDESIAKLKEVGGWKMGVGDDGRAEREHSTFNIQHSTTKEDAAAAGMSFDALARQTAESVARYLNEFMAKQTPQQNTQAPNDQIPAELKTQILNTQSPNAELFGASRQLAELSGSAQEFASGVASALEYLRSLRELPAIVDRFGESVDRLSASRPVRTKEPLLGNLSFVE